MTGCLLTTNVLITFIFWHLSKVLTSKITILLLSPFYWPGTLIFQLLKTMCPPHRMLHLTVNLRHTATLTHDDLRDHGAPATICRSILGACHQMRHQCIGRCRRLEGDPFAWPSGMSAIWKPDGLGFTPRHCSCLTSWLRTFLTSPRLSLPALRHARKNGHPKNRVRGTSASRTRRRWI